MLEHYSSFADLATSPCPRPSFASVKTSSGANWSLSWPQWHRRAQLLLLRRLIHRLQPHPLMHHLRHPPIQHPHTHCLQCQHVLHQCRLLHQCYQLPTHHYLSAGIVRANKNYLGITPHLMLIQPAATQQCPYLPSRSTTKSSFRNQTIRRISMAVLQPQLLLTYYPTARGISVSCVALRFGTYDVFLYASYSLITICSYQPHSPHILVQRREGVAICISLFSELLSQL